MQNFRLLFVLQIKVNVVALALAIKLDRAKDLLLVYEAVPATQVIPNSWQNCLKVMVFYQVFFQNNAAMFCKIISVIMVVIYESFIANRAGFFVEK